MAIIAVNYPLGIFDQSFESSLPFLGVFLIVRYRHCYWYKEQIHLLAEKKKVSDISNQKVKN